MYVHDFKDVMRVHASAASTVLLPLNGVTLHHNLTRFNSKLGRSFERQCMTFACIAMHALLTTLGDSVHLQQSAACGFC